MFLMVQSMRFCLTYQGELMRTRASWSSWRRRRSCCGGSSRTGCSVASCCTGPRGTTFLFKNTEIPKRRTKQKIQCERGLAFTDMSVFEENSYDYGEREENVNFTASI